MYIPQPVKINLKDGVVETAGGIRKITVVFMELLDLEIAVSDDKDTLDQVDCGLFRSSKRSVNISCTAGSGAVGQQATTNFETIFLDWSTYIAGDLARASSKLQDLLKFEPRRSGFR